MADSAQRAWRPFLRSGRPDPATRPRAAASPGGRNRRTGDSPHTCRAAVPCCS